LLGSDFQSNLRRPDLLQSLLHGRHCHFRLVALSAEMAQIQVAELTMHYLLGGIGSSFI
jgi:hypothetical protein